MRPYGVARFAALTRGGAGLKTGVPSLRQKLVFLSHGQSTGARVKWAEAMVISST